ncbi:MAG: enoyl-CoA hydratase-related protein [Gaiellales bacterium]
MSTGEVRTERHGPVGVLTFSNPERRNALTLAMFDAVPGAVASLADDPEVRAIVVRGEGREAFSAGADVGEFPEVRGTPEAALGHGRSVDAAVSAIAATRTPTIALLHGACFGGSGGIAAACALRFADDGLRFAIPAARLGVVYEVEPIRALVRVVGASAAYDILVSGRVVHAEEALRLGLVNVVLPPDELEAHAFEYAERLAANAPLSLEGAWLAIRALQEPEGSWWEELEAVRRRAMASSDFAEGLAAFLEKREPRFRGE